MLIRLNKFFSDSGICSRRKADEQILAGRVKINGQTAIPGSLVDPNRDMVTVDDRIIEKTGERIYYALYKPKGAVTTASDELGRQTVLDLVPEKPRVYPVGRLDADSEGLIILTNDGELTQKLTHPGFEHEKEYVVNAKVQTPNAKSKAEEIKRKFLDGLVINGHVMKADGVFKFDVGNLNFVIFHVILHTGRNRQIRKMCAKIGLRVEKLVRVRIGKLNLFNLDLKPGEHRLIKKGDIL